MKSILSRRFARPAVCLLSAGLCISMFSTSVLAQYGRGFHSGYGRPHHPQHHHSSNFDKALAVIGTVGAVAAIAGSRTPSYYRPYYRSYYYGSPVVVERPVFVERPVVVQKPVVIEKSVVVERPVVVERQVSVVSDAGYSSRLGASFRIEHMQIPGYRFTAARLISDPSEGSPLLQIGLRNGDVITRLDHSPVHTLAELDSHVNNTAIRYIKAGTTTVHLADIDIPASTEVFTGNAHYAP